MRFVKTTDGVGAHMLAHWSGPVMWMVCGEVVDMGRQSVMITDKVTPNGDGQEFCGDCARIEAQNAYIPGASR